MVDLNAEQRLAAGSRATRTLVKAGAGTGKTAASVGWVSSLISEGVPARHILMLTFTRKAAQEMLNRALSLAGSAAKGVTCGTYHVVAISLIRKAAQEFGFDGVKVSLLDQNDSRSLWKAAARTLGLKKPSPAVSTVADAVSSLRNRDQPIEPGLIEMFGESDAVQIAASYESLKKAGGMLDFDDLLVRWRDRLRDDANYACKLRAQFRYVLVDEMQDNNVLQYQILKFLAPEHLLVVGDVNQSIYGFRSADPALMMKFESEHENVSVIKLEVNYRSGQPILDLANEIMNSSESPLNLQSASDKHAAVEARRFETSDLEAGWVCANIRTLILRGKRPDSIAVLARSSRALMSLELELRRAKVEYKKYGGQTVAEAAEVKDFTAFVRIMHNRKDQPAMVRALTQFPGVGEVAAVKSAESDDFFGEYPKKAIEAQRWVELMGTMPFSEGLGYLLKRIGPLIEHNYPDSAPMRMQNLTSLVADCTASEFTLTDFIDAFVTERFEGEHPEKAITLSTVHSAKGLEWEHVYLLGAGSLQMPHPRASSREEIAEERRLLYVAVTRARTMLTMSYCSRLGPKQTQVQTELLPLWLDWRQ